MRLFSTEMVSRFHPDKYADQISDSILTAILKKDPSARVACECMVKDSTVVLAGEITTSCDIDYEAVVRSVADAPAAPAATDRVGWCSTPTDSRKCAPTPFWHSDAPFPSTLRQT